MRLPSEWLRLATSLHSNDAPGAAPRPPPCDRSANLILSSANPGTKWLGIANHLRHQGPRGVPIMLQYYYHYYQPGRCQYLIELSAIPHNHIIKCARGCQTSPNLRAHLGVAYNAKCHACLGAGIKSLFSNAPRMQPPRHLQLRLLHAVLLASAPNQPNPMKCPPLLHSAGKKRFHNRPQPNRTHPSSLFLSLSWSDAVTFNIIGGHRIPQTTVPHPSCQPMTVSQPRLIVGRHSTRLSTSPSPSPAAVPPSPHPPLNSSGNVF